MTTGEDSVADRATALPGLGQLPGGETGHLVHTPVLSASSRTGSCPHGAAGWRLPPRVGFV